MKVDVSASSAAIRDAVNSIKMYYGKSRLGLERIIANATRRIAYRTKQNAPKGPTGNLRKSIESSFSAKALRGEIKAVMPHAHLVEYGVRAHRTYLTGKHSSPPAKVLRFKSGGKTVFARSTRIPAIHARPFMGPAYKAEEPRLISEIETLLRRT
ncbi:MAG: HK97 gp10 family phage protein [Synergistes sp.]|nr:HK97 gp10 family phage protein [Synergistes sp.]